MMITRRQLGAAALGAGAALTGGAGGLALVPRPADAATNPFALAPDVAARWAKHQSEPGPRLVQLDNGVRLRSGPMGAVDRNGLAIWSRASWTGDFRATFKTRKRDANVGVGDQSLFLLLYFGARGDGTPGHPASLADWPGSTTPYTHAYAEHVSGARLTFYFQPPGAAGEEQPVSAAYFKADGSRNPVAAAEAVLFPGRRGVAYGWTVRRVGDTVTVTQNDAGTKRSVSFTSAAFTQFANAGSFGLLVAPGRAVEVRRFAVSR
jgi:hypothetical protein